MELTALAVLIMRLLVPFIFFPTPGSPAHSNDRL